MPLQSNNKTAVVYLMWLPYGIAYFKAFINSYLQHRHGHEHKLYIVFNGTLFYHEHRIEIYQKYLERYSIEADTSMQFEMGQDIEIYKKVAANIEEDYILFFNTYTQIKTQLWLKKYVINFEDNVGIIGASGSWQSYYSSVFQKNKFGWESKKGVKFNCRKYKLFLKAFFYWRFLFKPFPNPHIRTTGFMVRRKDLLKMRTGKLKTKFSAYIFENGRRSITNYFLRKKLKALVVDNDGRVYEPKQWINSETFWIGRQMKLMVSDNQTGTYSRADDKEKETMTKLAWGK